MNTKTPKIKIYERFLICLIITSIFVLGTLFFILKKCEFSESENRRLASPPTFSWESFIDGRAARETNAYLSDHFPARNLFISTHTIAELALGKGEANSVIAAKSGVLCARGEAIDQGLLKSNASVISAFLKECERGGAQVCVGVIPEKIDVFSEHLPPFYKNRNEELLYSRSEELFPETNYCNFAELFIGRGEKVYYCSDHHWNSDGAYEAYCEICHSLGVTPLPRESFSFERASGDFYGSAAARFGIKMASDTITLPRFSGDDEYVRQIGDRTFEGFYDRDKLIGADKYSVFLGGNAPLISVRPSKASQSESRPTMLIFRDSYSSALAPYLARHFNLVLCDGRYYRGTAHELAESVQASYILVLLGVEGVAVNDVSDFFALP